MTYTNVRDVTERLTELRARGDVDSLEEASRIEREYEEAVGDAAKAPAVVPPPDPDIPVQEVGTPQPPAEPPPVTPAPAGSERRGFTSDAAEKAAAEAGLTADQIAGTGKGGNVTVKDVRAATAGA